MQTYESLKHSVWECKDHVVFIPKYRRKSLSTQLRREIGQVFRSLAEQKECKVEEGHLMPDQVHMLLSIPPKYSVASVPAAHRPVRGVGSSSLENSQRRKAHCQGVRFHFDEQVEEI